MINSYSVQMDDGSITVNEGAILQISTFRKDRTAWANPY